jgi:tRNA pseudouridine55 synthase
MNGLLVIDKPAGPTSHDIVAAMRRTLGEPRIGHTGTLDPAATGVLPLVLGSATRLARFLSARDKGYDATITLGAATDTYDAAGQIVGDRWSGAWPDRATVERALESFLGTFLQTPPAFSAKRVQGARSHRLARRAARGTADSLQPEFTKPAAAPVTVDSIELLELSGPRLVVRVDCSAGFYVRSLAHDLGGLLGTRAHLEELRRTRSGSLTLQHAVAFSAVVNDRPAAIEHVLPMAAMLPDLPAVHLTGAGVRYATHGRDLGPSLWIGGTSSFQPSAALGHVRLVDEAGELLGLAVPAREPGLLHPSVILK